MLLDELPIGWPTRLRPDRLAALAFQTPYLAGDVTVVADRLARFRSRAPGLEPYYTVKANPAPEVISTLAGLDAGFQAGSFSELKLLMESGVEGSRVLLGNYVRTGPQLQAAAAAGVWRMAFDSVDELQRIAENAPGACVYLHLRIAGEHPRPLGADPQQAQALMLSARELGLVPYGLSFEVGSSAETTLGVVGRVMTGLLEAGVGVAMLNLVSGAAELPRGLLDRMLPYRPDNLICEPGRSLVEGSAVLVTTVLDRSHRNGADWLILDAGVHQGLTSADAVATLESDAPAGLFQLAGPTTDPADVIARDVPLPGRIAAGDLVMFGDHGAYCRAAGHNGFEPPRRYFV